MKMLSAKRIYVIIPVIMIIVVGVVIILQNHRKSTLDFPMYAFASLQPNIKEVSHEVLEIQIPSRHYRMLGITTSNENWYVSEMKDTAEGYADSLLQCTYKIENSDCRYLTSPAGQKYTIQTYYYNNQPFAQTISWFNGTTTIWISFKEHSDQVNKYSDESWGAIIDSAYLVDYSKEKVKVDHYSGL